MRKKYRISNYKSGKLTPGNIYSDMTPKQFEKFYDKLVREGKEPVIFIEEVVKDAK